MQNPSFESVVVAPQGLTNTHAVLETATTQVQQWTRTSSSLGMPLVFGNGAFGLTALHLTRMGALDSVGSSLASEVQGLAGRLSATTIIGQPYTASAGIGSARLQSAGFSTPSLLPYQPALFEMRLRDSVTGAESAPVLQTSIDQDTSWVVITGVVTPTSAYDSVVLRFYSPDAALNARTGLVDDVRLCRSATVPSTPDLPAASALAAAAKQTVAPAAGPTCATDAANLVENNGFESVTGAPGLSGEWRVRDPLTDASSGSFMTDVPSWTRTDRTSLWPSVLNSGNPYGGSRAASQGARYAQMWPLPQAGPGGAYQGLVGTLASTTSVGTTYVVSAETASDDQINGPTFEFRLRNSATGAESDAAVQTSSTLATDWGRITGTVTANAAYDRVVLRYRSYGGAVGASQGLVDDVRVCEAALVASAPDSSAPRIIAILIGLLVAILIGGVGFALRTKVIGPDDGVTISDMAPLLSLAHTAPDEPPGSRRTVSIAIEPASASLAAPGDPHDPRQDGEASTGGVGSALRTTFVGTSNGGVWRSEDATGRVTAVPVDPRDPSGDRSIGDPHETTGDGVSADVPPPGDYDADGFKVTENESPRPMDRAGVTDLKGDGSSQRGGTVNDPGSSL